MRDLHAELARPEEPVDILAEAQRGVEHTDRFEGAARVHATPQVHVGQRLRVRILEVHVRHPFARVGDVLHASEDDVAFRVVLQPTDLEVQLAVGPRVVGVAERQQLTMRGRDAVVARRRGPRVVLAKGAYPVAEARDDTRGVVGGAVVDDDDLERLVVLALDALHRLAKDAAPRCRRARRH